MQQKHRLFGECSCSMTRKTKSIHMFCALINIPVCSRKQRRRNTGWKCLHLMGDMTPDLILTAVDIHISSHDVSVGIANPKKLPVRTCFSFPVSVCPHVVSISSTCQRLSHTLEEGSNLSDESLSLWRLTYSSGSPRTENCSDPRSHSSSAVRRGALENRKAILIVVVQQVRDIRPEDWDYCPCSVLRDRFMCLTAESFVCICRETLKPSFVVSINACLFWTPVFISVVCLCAWVCVLSSAPRPFSV